VPSTLLERRPDIAAAERTMQQENALIGATIALYYPDVSLTGMFGFTGTGALALSLANEVWTASTSAAQIAFDAGLRDAEVEAALAAYHQSVANYRQTVLTAFQQVEDELVAIRLLARQQKVIDDAVKAAQQEVDVYLNQYQAGTIAFTAVVVAQAQLLADQESALTVRQDRFPCRRRADRGARRRLGYGIPAKRRGVGDEKSSCRSSDTEALGSISQL